MLFVNNKIIPIEIKSPSEELYVNVKGIRQALENKIILESRYNNLSNFKIFLKLKTIYEDIKYNEKQLYM